MNGTNHLNRDSVLAATDNGLQIFTRYLSPHFPGGRIEPGLNISNPFLSKPQRTPSFNVYRDRSGIWRYKDFAHADCSGDCFDFMAQMNGLDARKDFHAVLERIRNECALNDGYNHSTEQDQFSIEAKEFSPDELKYWEQYGIDAETLERFGVRSLTHYTRKGRNGKHYMVSASNASPIYAYPYGTNAIKVYRPLATKDKFRFLGTKPSNSLWGLEQLSRGTDFVILAAGEKDVLTASAHNLPAVTLNSETSRLSDSALETLRRHSGTILCCYDTDATGKAAAAWLLAEYNIPLIPLPAWIADGEGKDLSDFFRLGGTATEFRALIDETLTAQPVPVAVNDSPKVNGVNSVNGPQELFQTTDAVTLLAMEFTEPEWIVDRLLPPGLAILGGRPKQGKSWLALNLALAVASGGKAFGSYQADTCETLYLALEDNHRRLQRRLSMILNAERNTHPPAGLRFKNKFRRFDNGGFDDLRTYLAERPETRLVIIDTLAKLRGRQRGGKDTYAGDYLELGELHAIARDNNITILVVHHTTKMAYADPFDAISGTSGISGAADTLFVLKQEPGGTTLYARGRDIEEAEIAMKFDHTTGVWSALGNAADVRLSEQRQKIIAVISDNGALTPKEIAEAAELSHGSVRHLCRKMAKDGTLIVEDGKYSLPPVHSIHSVHSGHPFPSDSPAPE